MILYIPMSCFVYFVFRVFAVLEVEKRADTGKSIPDGPLIDTLGSVLESIISVKRRLAQSYISAHIRWILQSGIVTAQRLSNQVRLNKLLSGICAHLQLESLSQARLYSCHPRSKTRHFRIPSHHGNQVDDIFS